MNIRHDPYQPLQTWDLSALEEAAKRDAAFALGDDPYQRSLPYYMKMAEHQRARAMAEGDTTEAAFERLKRLRASPLGQMPTMARLANDLEILLHEEEKR